MATLNTIDGVITSAGNNPPLNTDLICTLYRITFPVNGGSIQYVSSSGAIKNFTQKNLAISDRVGKIISMSGVTLTDLGLVFTIAAETPAPTFKTVKTNTTLQVKSYKIYFGTPTSPNGTISYNDETGAPKQVSMIGTTTTIKATRFSNLFNVRVVDLNPEIPDVAPTPAPPFTIAIGTYGTIVCPVNTTWLNYINPPVVPLVSGGDNPILGQLFAATNYAIGFPEVGTGTIEYVDNNGKTKTYTLNKTQVYTADGLLRDGITKVNTLSNVTLKDEGLMYQIVEPIPAPNYVIPTAMPIVPTKPKFYQVYFGNPVYPQGSITWFDAKGVNKAATSFGKVMTIDASKIVQLNNVKIVEVGDVI